MLVQGEAETGMCKGLNGLVGIVDALKDAGAREILNQAAGFPAVLRGVYEFAFAGPGYPYLRVFIHIAVGMSAENNRFRPVSDCGLDIVHHNGFP